MKRIICFKSKRMIEAVALSLLSIVLCFIATGSFKMGLLFTILFIAAGIVDLKGTSLKSASIIIWFLTVSFVTLFLSQFIQNEILFDLPIKRIILGGICCLIPMLLLFSLTLKLRRSAILISFLLLLLSTINAYVYEFRGSELCPADFLSVQTAMNVAGNYSYRIMAPVLFSWLAFLAFFLFCKGMPHVSFKRTMKYRIISAVACICLLVVLVTFSKDFPTQHFLHGGSFYNGYILNFTKEIPEVIVHKPNDYSPKSVALTSKNYVHDSEIKAGQVPDIIVIMDEAYSDLSVLGGELSTNIPVSPFINSLRKNTSYGYTLTSAYGGGTPNSEYEFLTGNTLLFVNGIVYQQYLHEPSYSLVSVLKNYGYQCIAMHPYLANGWKRNTVWPNLMFDEIMFLDRFPQRNLMRGLVSDQEMFEVLLDTYKAEKKNNKPVFLFGVTMQNHSSYDYDGEDFRTSITLEGYDQNYPDAEQYLSLINETDKAVEYLLKSLEEIDHEVVVVFYGDHQPALDESFLQEVHGGGFNTLDEKQLLQIVPFFIWTNYESKTEELSLTSLNYLSNYMLQKAGLPLPAYNSFLSDVEKQIPAMNVKGYYSIKNGGFKSLADAEGDEKDLLDRYWTAEYNSLFDLKHLDSGFFPLKN